MKPAGSRPAPAHRRDAPGSAHIAAAPRFALARRVTDDLARLYSDLASAARRVRRGHDRDAAHDLRVASRRMASALDVWAGLLPGRRAERVQKQLRKLRRAAGSLRDAEVQRDLLARTASGLPHYSRLAVEDLSRRMERRMLARIRPTARAARKKRLGRLERALDRSLRSLERPGGAASARADAIARVTELERIARSALASALRDRQDDALHAARIAVKRWRYGLESLRPLDPLGAIAAARRAPALIETRALQRALGRLHDLAELREAIEKRIEQLLERERRAEAEALQEALPVIERERERPLAELQGLVTTRRSVSRRRAAG